MARPTIPIARRAITFLLAAAVASIWLVAVHRARGQHNDIDLRIYRDSLTYWLHGHSLYSFKIPGPRSLGFTYPPFAAILMSPLVWLPASIVADIWSVAVIAALFLTILWILPDRVRRFPLSRRILLCLTVSGVMFFVAPIRDTLSFGQVNVFLAVAVLADVQALRRGSRWGGVGVGLAAAFKLTPAVFIVYLLVTRRVRAACTAMATVACVTLVSAAIAPATSTAYWLHIVWQSGRVGGIGSTSNQSLFGLLTRLANDDARRGGHAPAVFWLLACATASCVGLWRARCAFDAGDDLAGFVLVGLLAGLVSPISWVHHLFWVVPACVILVDVALLLRRFRPALAAVAIYIVAVSHVIDNNWRHGGQHYAHGVLGVLIENTYVIITVLLLLFLPFRRSDITTVEKVATNEAASVTSGSSR